MEEEIVEDEAAEMALELAEEAAPEHAVDSGLEEPAAAAVNGDTDVGDGLHAGGHEDALPVAGSHRAGYKQQCSRPVTTGSAQAGRDVCKSTGLAHEVSPRVHVACRRFGQHARAHVLACDMHRHETTSR